MFFDSGNAFNDWSTPLEYSVGIGVRWKLPMLMIGVDVAQALSRVRPEAALPSQHHPGVVACAVVRWCCGLLLALAGAVACSCTGCCSRSRASISRSPNCDRLPTLQIEVRGARGTIAGPLDGRQHLVDHEAAHIVVRGLSVDPEPSGLIVGHIGLEGLAVSHLAVTLKERPPQPDKPPYFLPSGLRITAPGFRLGDIGSRCRRAAHRSGEATGSLSVTRWRLDLDRWTCADRTATSRQPGVRATEPLGLRTDLRGEWRLPGDDFEYRFRVVTRGNLDRLGADIFLDAPAKLMFRGHIARLDRATARERHFAHGRRSMARRGCPRDDFRN